MSTKKQNKLLRHTAAKQLKELTVIQILVYGLLFAVLFRPLYADTDLSPDSWEIRLMPYFYMPEAEADLEISGRSGPVDLSISEMFKYLDFSAMGRVEAWKGRWGLLFDGIYFNLEVPVGFAGPGVTSEPSLDERIGSLDFGLSYRLLEQRFGQNDGQRFAVEPYGGLRYTYLRQVASLDLAGIPLKLGRSEDWVEPFLGGRLCWDLNKTIGFDVRADAGGFGIGSASDLMWQVAFQLTYRLSDNTAFNAGYRVMDLDYHRGSGLDELGINVHAKGPFIGMTFTF